ncbi:MAG: sigma-70 family RNA polymerase sigma factor [Actinobacteria bacterium]|nr:sigma-70 family RNA polymerase sigma factor [Actinomycetota bacterium]
MHAARQPQEVEIVDTIDAALPVVYDYLVRRCGSKAVAEDLLSDTVLSAVSQAMHGRVPDLSTAYLVGIARHKLADHWRREARASRHLESVGFAAEAVAGVEESFDSNRTARTLAGLSAMHRMALVLRYVDGLPVAEVAAEFGRSLHATETLLMRAKAAFRSHYSLVEFDDA